MKRRNLRQTILAIGITLSFLTPAAFVASSDTNELPELAGLLIEARTTASRILESDKRSAALEHIVLAQVGIDSPGARDSLNLFPDLLNNPNHLLSRAFVYAKAGNVEETERMHTEILKGDGSSRHVKLASANALGYVAIAYANAGKMKEAFRTLSQLKEQFKGESLAIFGMATAGIAEAQAKQGDIHGAVQTARTDENEVAYTIMNIARERVQAGDMPGALQIVSELEEGLQRYAKWGIVQAQSDQGYLTEAQLTASTIKPGHAKASALLTIATQYIKARDKPRASRLLREAASDGSLIVNNWTRADTLWHIAASVAAAGDYSVALATAKSIEKDSHRRSAIADIAEAQAEQGKFKDAFDTALLLKETSGVDGYGADVYVRAISTILVQLARSGRAKEALEAVSRFVDLKPQYKFLYCTIAAAQAESGDIQGARATLSHAETEEQRKERRQEMAKLISLLKQGEDSQELRQLRVLQHIEHETQPALRAIALTYARLGSLAEASNIALDFDFPERERLFEEIGKVSSESGHKTPAITWARALTSPSDKTYALIGIAHMLSVPKSKPAAKQ